MIIFYFFTYTQTNDLNKISLFFTRKVISCFCPTAPFRYRSAVARDSAARTVINILYVVFSDVIQMFYVYTASIVYTLHTAR